MNLTTEQIHSADTKVLNFRYARLLEKGRKLQAKDITCSEAKEILQIEDELHTRLLEQLGRDPYPPDRIREEAPSNYMISLLKRAKPKVELKPKVESEPKPESDGKLNMKVTITSSIGSKVATFNVKVHSKGEADKRAKDEIEKLGLKKATWKIS